MHLRIVEGNPAALKHTRAELKVVHRNDELEEGLWLDIILWARIFPPPFEEREVIHDDIDMLKHSRTFYEELPYSLRKMKPLEGHFKLLGQGHTTNANLRRRHIDLQLSRYMAYHRDWSGFQADVDKLEKVMQAFAKPWHDANWVFMPANYISFQNGKACPPWLIDFCTRRKIRLEVMTGMDVPAYAGASS